MSEIEKKPWWQLSAEEEQLKQYCSPFEELRRRTSRPYVFGEFRWFRGENVRDLERYRRYRASRTLRMAPTPRGDSAA
jgi:hypothetical protein